MNFANIKFNDIANGKGIRTSLFVSGCRNNCDECFNKEAQDFNYGNIFDREIEEKIINSMDQYHAGISLLGGEPLEPENAKELLSFVKTFKSICPDKSIWMYTGYIFENIIALDDSDSRKQLLLSVDILIDGPFIKDLYSVILKFKGSANQRIIDINKYKETGEIIEVY